MPWSQSFDHTHYLQRFIATGIEWPLPDTISFAQLDEILYANRKKDSTPESALTDISEVKRRKKRRTRQFEL